MMFLRKKRHAHKVTQEQNIIKKKLIGLTANVFEDGPKPTGKSY